MTLIKTLIGLIVGLAATVLVGFWAMHKYYDWLLAGAQVKIAPRDAVPAADTSQGDVRNA